MKWPFPAGVFLLAAITLALAAVPASAAVTCSYSAPDHRVSVSATDDFTRVLRSGDAITIDDGHEAVPCGGSPTVLNTDLIQIGHTGLSAATIDLKGGPFAPGFTPEPVGASEIELQYLAPTFVDIRGTAAAEQLGFAAGGANP